MKYEKINIKRRNSNNGEKQDGINNNEKKEYSDNIINNKIYDNEINKENNNIYKNLKDSFNGINLEKDNKNLKESYNDINVEKDNKNLKESYNDIDIEKDNKNLKEGYNDINIEKNNKNLKDSYNDINVEKDNKNLKDSYNDINIEKNNKNLKESYNDINIEKDNKNLKDSYNDINDDKICNKNNNSEDKNKALNNNINDRNDQSQIIDINGSNNEDRQKEEKKLSEEKKFKNNLKILLINLEAKHVNIEEIKEKINIVLQGLFNDDSSFDEKLNKLIEKTTEIFEQFLELSNNLDKENLKNIIKSVNKEDDIESFKDYIFAILENYIDFANLKKDIEIIIQNYIFDFMQSEMMKNKKDELIKKYNNNYIIKYDMFNEDIVLKNNKDKIFMDNNAVEYLLYLMKKSIIDKKDYNYLMDDLDLEIFLNFYTEKP